ncbi:MAG TPA: protein phosphatase 2C domain-containing protein [Anaerolineales bacterium]|nr:protein phosphatase 2C domain-containing protein [Anaerolineales bacterium]
MFNWFGGKKQEPAREKNEPPRTMEDTLIPTGRANDPKTLPALQDTGPRMKFAHAQSTGMVRKNNQDVLMTVTITFEGDEKFPNFGLYLVADGMGGHSQGERASAVAARSVANRVLQNIYLELLVTPEDKSPIDRAGEILKEALETANLNVIGAVPNGGTTMTAALLVEDTVILGHVGDSRAYLWDGSNLSKLTLDHSLVQRLQDLGQITADEASVHPQRNVLYRAVGQGEGLEVDVYKYVLEIGQRLVLCSDGLWSMVDERTLTHLVLSHPNDMQAACKSMVQAANGAGGPDNITVVMVERTR